MRFRIAASLFFLLCIFPFLTSAQNSSNPHPLDPELQKFLNVPVWYLSFRTELSVNGGGGSAEEGSWTYSVERIVNGTQVMGVRSQGPSLSMPNLAAEFNSGPPRMDEIMAHYANWISGGPYDDDKSEAENDAEFNRVFEANKKAMETLRYSRWDSGTSGPNWERAGGAGEVFFGGTVQLEFDAEHKKYNFLFAPVVADSMTSYQSVTGESVLNEGSESENRRAVATGFHNYTEEIVSFVPPFASGPTHANIVGDLPGSFGPISGTSSHQIKVKHHGRLVDGTYNIQYTFSPAPPEPVELLIIPPDGYDDWRPLGGKDEKTLGDWILVPVKLQKPGGADPRYKAARFNYELKNTSREKGVCLNSPRIPDPKLPFDLQFEAGRNSPDVEIIGPDRQTAIEHGDKMKEGSIAVSSFDYGAYGELEVFAELENGQVVYGKVQGTNAPALKLPARRDGSLIAKSFVKGLGNVNDKDDKENVPVGDGFEGDGLSLYEEYRGFMHGDYWTAADPKKKDIFVLNQIRGTAHVRKGIALYEKATKLRVRPLLKDDQVNGDMVINFNHSPATHVVDQHVIRIKVKKGIDQGSANVEEVGTPGTARSVNMPTDWTVYSYFKGRKFPNFAITIAHEMLHATNVYHHGEADKKVIWHLISNPRGTDYISEQEVYYDEAQDAYVNVDGSAPEGILVKKENGSTLSPHALFPRGSKSMYMSLGWEHGQHSGVEDCLMRYDNSEIYKSKTDSYVRYLTGGEPSGMGLCTTRTGSGVNSHSRQPQSRYSDAATTANGGEWVTADRGKCQTQIRVNDLGEEPHR